MEIDTATNPALNDNPVQEVENEPENQVDEAQAAIEGDEPDSQAIEPEFDEIDIDGKLYKVPKEIAPHVMKNADYTQKTQALAEQRRAWEDQAAQERERIQFENETFEHIRSEDAQRVAIQGRMEALRGVNFNALTPQDAARYNHEMMQLQWSYNDLSANIENRKAEIAAQRESEASTAWGQTVEALSRPDDKLGWSGKFDEATQARLADVAIKELGVPQNRLRATLSDPIAVKALNLAAIGLETLKRQKAALSAKPKTPEANPVTTVGGNKAKGAIDMGRLTTDEWMKARNKQIANKR